MKLRRSRHRFPRAASLGPQIDFGRWDRGKPGISRAGKPKHLANLDPGNAGMAEGLVGYRGGPQALRSNGSLRVVGWRWREDVNAAPAHGAGKVEKETKERPIQLLVHGVVGGKGHVSSVSKGRATQTKNRATARSLRSEEGDERAEGGAAGHGLRQPGHGAAPVYLSPAVHSIAPFRCARYRGSAHISSV